MRGLCSFFVYTGGAKGIKTLPYLILRSKQLPNTNVAKQEEGKCSSSDG